MSDTGIPGGESKREAATSTGHLGGPFSCIMCDCDKRGCRAWHVMSGDKVMCVAQTKDVASRITKAVYWESKAPRTGPGSPGEGPVISGELVAPPGEHIWLNCPDLVDPIDRPYLEFRPGSYTCTPPIDWVTDNKGRTKLPEDMPTGTWDLLVWTKGVARTLKAIIKEPAP